MLSENNHIDTFLRQKTKEAAVNNNRIEADWQQMKTMLSQPGIVPAPKPNRSLRIRRYFAYAAGAILIITVTTLMTMPVKKKIKKINPVITKTNTLRTPVQQKVATNSLTVTTKKDSKTVSLIQKQKTTPSPAVTILPHKTNATLAQAKPDAKAIFTNFYEQLKKPAQEFVINTRYDTTIRCKEGTSLFVPAGCFQNLAGISITGNVSIYIQEFYSFEDIISNKLTTTSNGMPLETGGMLNINARANKEEVKIKPGATLDVKMPTRIFDPNMQLFVGQDARTRTIMDTIRASLSQDFNTRIKRDTLQVVNTNRSASNDRAVFASFGDGVNWIPAGQQQFFFNDTYKRVTVMDFRDDPILVRTSGKKTIAKFMIPFYCKLSTTEMQHELEKRYSKYYDVIKVKREWKPILKKNRIETLEEWYSPVSRVGDSISIPLYLATKFKLITKEDSIAYETKFLQQYQQALKEKRSYAEFLQKKDDYNFRISNLGWINCDRFSGYPDSRLTELVINPGDGFEETYFQAMLIFDKERSAMPGYWTKGKINFPRLPVGQVVNVICTGVKDGKMYASVQQLVVEKFTTPSLQFEETSSDQFREKLRQFGNVTKLN